MATIRVYFPKIRTLFSNFRERTWETSSPPSSYALDLTCHYSYSHIYFPFIKTLRRNIWKSTFNDEYTVCNIPCTCLFFPVNLSVSANVF